MNFASPAWLWALLLLLPLFALRIRSHMSSRRSLTGLIAPRLHTKLVKGTSQIRHWLAFVFLLLGLSMIIIAMARPRWGYEVVESFSEGRSLILAIDTSRSMLATDLVPNRLERAKLAARDIVDGLGEDRIGLIAFAGKAFMQAPLTTDHQAVIESIEQIDTEIIPRGGTNLTSAATLALKSFREADAEQNALIIFSDGEALEGQNQVNQIKESANRENMSIITVGVGTENGSIIPEPGADGRPQEGAFIKDTNGQLVRSRLDTSALRELATGGGIFLRLGDQGALTRVVKSITANLASNEIDDAARQRPIERFMWPLSLGLIFLIFSHMVHLLFLGRRKRRSIPAPSAATAQIITILALLAPGATQAKDGWNHIERENYEAALKQFELSLSDDDITRRERSGIQLGIGSAAYKVGDYERASKAYGNALIRSSKSVQEQAHYNLGNTLYRKGETTLQPPSTDPHAPAEMEKRPEKISATLRQWLGALEHYQAALNLNRKNSNARHNIEIVKERIEWLKNEQEQEQEQQQPPEEEEPQEPPPPEPQENNEEQEQDDNEESENSEEEEQEDNPEEDSGDQNQNGEDEGDQPEEQGEQGNQDPANDNQPEENQPNGEEEANQPPDPGDGELTAEDNSSEPRSPPQVSPDLKNSETGYSPSEARQLIEALADENGELRPVYPRASQNERYKNW